MRHIRRVNTLRYSLATAVAAGFSSGCEADCCSPFVPLYYAVVYGTVTQAGQPAEVEVRGEVLSEGCPAPATTQYVHSTGSQSGGAYRLLLSSESQAEGQCMRLIAGDAEPLRFTLTGMPFTSESPEQVRDSMQINIEVP
jgi:hypothetical protein